FVPSAGSPAVDGVRIVGPIVWHLTDPSTLAGQVWLTARVSNQYDLPVAPGLVDDFVRASNNVAAKSVPVNAGPRSTGEQDTLFVPVHFSGEASPAPSASAVWPLANGVKTWLEQ